MAATTPQHTLSAGTVLMGRYKLEKVIGLGGMSAVYAALDERFRTVRRRCAVKEMFDMLPDKQMREQARGNFEREANILASLDNVAIPKVYDFFAESDRFYLVLEFIDGQDLGQILRQRARPLAADQVLHWAQQICNVLSYLHALAPPIIFRDMKPSNVMLRKDGQVMLIDFGIAKHFAPVQRGTMIGTEGYAPPEQYEGAATPQVDVYGLGATLHHLLTNTDPQEFRPFSFDSRPIRQYNPAVSPQFEAIINRALAYDAADRWGSTAEMHEALRALGGRGTSTFNRMWQASGRSAPTNWELPQPRPGTGPVGGGGATHPVGSATQPVGGATQPVGGAGVPAARPGGVALPGTQPDGGSVGETVAPLWTFICEEEVRSSPLIDEERLYIGCYDNNLYCLHKKSGDFIWKFATEGGIPGTPAATDKLVIVGSEDYNVHAVNRVTGRVEWTFPTGGRVRSSPRIAYDHVFIGSDDGYLYAINAHRGWQQWKTDLGAPVRSTPITSDKLVIVGCEDGNLVGADIMSGEIAWRMRTNGPVVSSPALWGQERVIIGSMDWMVYGVDPVSGWVIWRFRMSDGIVSSPAVEGDRVFIGGIDGALICLEAEWGKLLWRFRTNSQITSSPVVHDGLLYFGCVDGSFYCLDSRLGKLVWRATTGAAIPGSPRVSDGIVYIGSTDHHVYAFPAGRPGR